MDSGSKRSEENLVALWKLVEHHCSVFKVFDGFEVGQFKFVRWSDMTDDH